MSGTAPTPLWHQDAKCKGLTELFYIEDAGRPSRKRLAKPLAVCAACPVTDQCLQDALDRREPFGIWGGTTPAERAAMLGVDINEQSSETWRRYRRITEPYG